MGRTPDRFPGARFEEELVLENSEFTQSGSIKFDSGSFYFQYNDGSAGVHRHYAPSVVDPVATPNDGDRYYNTDLEMEMRYDSTRSKWLSIEGAFFMFGRNGNTPPGSYYRGTDGVVHSDVRGYTAIYSGTYVALGYTMDPATESVFEFIADGSVIGAVTSSVPVERETGLNIDFAPDNVLAIRNSDSSPITKNVTVWARVKWRA